MANTINRSPAGVSIYHCDWIEPDSTRIPGATLSKHGRSVAHLDLTELVRLADDLDRLIHYLQGTHEQENPK